MGRRLEVSGADPGDGDEPAASFEVLQPTGPAPRRRSVIADVAGRARVLFAYATAPDPLPALSMAAAFAEAYRGRLFALQVTSPTEILDQSQSGNAEAKGDDLAHLRDLCGRVSGRGVLGARLLVRRGDLRSVTAELANSAHASLIVVPAGEALSGRAICRMALSLSRPVLLGRGFHHRRIVAATDLRDRDYSILRVGVDLASHLLASISFLHNVRPVLPWPPNGVDGPFLNGGFDPNELILGARRDHLLAASCQLGSRASVLLRSEDVTAAAIIQCARERSADLTIVGTRDRSWLSDLVDPRVAATVAERCHGSVLVVPLPPPASPPG